MNSSTTIPTSASYAETSEALTKAIESLPKWGQITVLIVCIAILVIGIMAQWKIFVKAGEAGWKCLIPIYNLYIITKIATGNGILFLLLLIPIVDIVFCVWLYIQLAKSFGKSIAFGVGLIFLTFIFECILGFGSAKYIGPQGQISGVY